MVILPGTLQITESVPSKENKSAVIHSSYFEEPNVLTNSSYDKLNSSSDLASNLTSCNLIDGSNDYTIDLVHKKKMVLMELKNNAPNTFSYLYNSSNDSTDGEGEPTKRETNSCNQNHIMNNKKKFPKIVQLGLNQYPLLKKSEKIDYSSISANILAVIQQKKGVKEENEKTKTEDVNLQNAPRASKLIRVNSSKNFKSIYNHKAAIEDTEKLSSSSSVALKTLKIDFKKDVSKSSRDHFYKSFSLLVKLGGRNMLDVSSKKTQSDNLWQVEYNELLWLEIRAWQYGHTIDEEDNRLQEERFKVDKVLDEVINFKFSAYESSYNNLTGQNEKNNSYISANQKLPVISQTNLDAGKDSQLNPNSTFVFPLHPDFFDKNRYIGAMKVVVELLKKVDNVEKLYPSRESLVNEHLKYKDVKFVRNYEALLFWRNINLDIFHTMYMLSRWINIDLEDELVWKDWFLHGLELAHFQVKHSFYNSKWCSGNLADVLKSSSASLLSDQNEVRKSRKGKNAHHSSIIQQTSTSRYRSFVETEMRTSGFFGLMRHVKNLLKSTFVKGQFIYSDQKNVNLTNNEIDVAFEKKEAGKILNIVNSLSVAPVDTESDFSMLSFGNGVQYVKACQEMCLPSFLDNYLFLTRVPIDIVHESVRFRIEYKPKVEPSYLSIRQLIHECKEVISGSVMSKHYYKSIIGPFLSEVSQTQVQLYNAKIQEFEADLKSMLNLYFDYLQHWIRLVHKMEKTSENLKNILDEEWNFTKEICTFVHGGESIAAYKFCVMVSDILKSSSQYLKDSIDSLFSKSKLQEENNNFRQTIAAVCFEYRSVINEVRARASKGLGFAKLLCKDLGIAAKYEVISSYEKCFSKLKSSNHMMIEHDFTTDFIIFAPATLANRKRQCKQMISLIRGFDDPDDRSWCMDGYIILIKSPTEKVFWKGKRTTLDTSIDLDLALSNIKVEGMILICSNSFHLNSQRKNVEKLLNECIKVTSEQTSSHNLIEKSLEDLNNSALRLANVIVSGIDDIGHNLDTYYSTEIDAADAIYLKKLCVGSMHLCFSLGFEYLREVVRLLTGHWRIELSKLFLRLSKIWIKFVMTKTERGRGTRPRWAAQGMEFLIAAIDPINLEQISGEEFQNLKSEMQACARHVIGTYATPMEPKIKESHSSNSFLNRSRSLTQSRKSLDTQTKGDKPDSNHKDSSHLQSHITHASSESSLSLEGNGSLVEESYEESVEDTKEIAVPVIVRVRNAIKEIEERRTAKLQHMGVIGSVTYKKPDLAVELMQLNFRRVHFKWQLGNKIGEGQFGKVFSCVNLDTGELMAMKQIRFNPNDYGTIQSIADEITNVQSVKHDSLVKYFGVEVHKDEMLIFMEYCEDGTIAEVAKLGLPESLIRVYTYQIIKAVDFLHKNGIIHRDIKGANIFLSSSGLIKIGDFGSAVKLKDAFETCQGEVFNTRGTAAFMAPEVITLDKGCGYGRAADIWSVGCVVIEMVTGKQPWSEYDNVYAIMYKVGGGQIPAIPDNLSEEGKHFLMCCFREQHHRWTSAMLEDHPFVKCC